MSRRTRVRGAVQGGAPRGDTSIALDYYPGGERNAEPRHLRYFVAEELRREAARGVTFVTISTRIGKGIAMVGEKVA